MSSSCLVLCFHMTDSPKSKLKPITEFAQKMQTRSGFGNSIKKAILFKAEANQVTEFREKLTQALAEFGVGLLISAIWMHFKFSAYVPHVVKLTHHRSRRCCADRPTFGRAG